MKRNVPILLLTFLLTLVGFALPSTAIADTCSTGWGSLPKGSGFTMSQSSIVTVRVGTHTCFDRIVLDVTGPIGSQRVQYVSQVTGIASGIPINVPGGARLLVTVFNPSGSLMMPSIAGFPTLRSVVNAGSFEGVTEFGIGVRARLPFRVFTLTGPGSHNRLIIDVARHW